MKKRLKPHQNTGSKKNVEQGTIIKKGKGLIKAAIVYPNTYKAGMSSLGFQTVYRLANQLDNVACERVFLPDKRQKTKPLKSLETGLSLHKFDIILFSISFENDFIHLVQLLGEAGIPLRSPDRNHIHPLVVAGGVACFLNPEPIAPFIDCFLLGEAECLIEPFFDLFSKVPEKISVLKTIETKVPGAYVPCLHLDNSPFSIQVQYLARLDAITTRSTILTTGTAFKDIFLIETLKGCPHGCRFCSAGFVYRPPRPYPVQNIFAAIDSAKGKTTKIGLVSSAVADHPDIINICEYGLAKGFSLSFSSLRADKLTDKFISALTDSKVKTATIAPEAGSQRMRDIINKKINEDDILTAAKNLITGGILNLRLYFMIGLPFEAEQDVHEIVSLTQKIKKVFLDAARKKKRIGTITLSINPFIPKPGTPFQWAAMESEATLKQKVKILKDGLKKTANVRLNIESLRKAKIHALLSLGDRKAADMIEAAQTSGWATAFKQNKRYCDKTIYREKSTSSPLPWDFLDNQINKKFLEKEYKRAKQERTSAPCPMVDCEKCRTCV